MPVRSLSLLLLFLACAGIVSAHQVPSMTVEADFAIARGFVLKINFDPRLFLSEQPTSLPPVPASWYQDQSEAERAKTHEDALAYLRKNLELQFGAETMALPELKLEPIDGADNTPLKPETAEVHLLATANAVIPASANDKTDFRISLGREAHVSLILLNRMEGQKDVTPRVVFGGETSQAFPLTGVLSLEAAIATYDPVASSKSPVSVPWIIRGIISFLLLVVWALFRKKRRRSVPVRRHMR